MTSTRLVHSLLLLFAGQAAAQRPAFEIVSIRINKSGSTNSSMGPEGSRLVARNVMLRTLLLYAYRPSQGPMLDAQIIGEPSWAKTDRFDIEAKPEGGERVLPGAQTRAMVQSLLEDLFHLKAHRETRDLPVYNLVLTKRGPKLSADQTPPDQRQAFISVAAQGENPAPLPRGALRLIAGPTTTVLTGTAIPIATIVTLLQGKTDRVIVDKSGFSGLIDVQIEFRQDMPAEFGETSAPSLLTAIQELGLKLESAKAPLEVLVIDTVQRPAGN